MRRYSAIFLLTALFALSGTASAQSTPEPTRGELLYTTHCIACHNARVHWRDQRLAKDWMSLRAQVRRWQGIQKLRWTEEDISEVARYLNTFYYNFPPPG
jgi:mono/diheme cytochrome c family protein